MKYFQTQWFQSEDTALKTFEVNFYTLFATLFSPFMTQYARTELEGCKRNLDVLQNDFETKKF